MSRLEERQEAEKAALEEEIKAMMKGAKKSKKRDLETKAMQMEYDLRGRHIEETDFLEEHGCRTRIHICCCICFFTVMRVISMTLKTYFLSMHLQGNSFLMYLSYRR